MECFFSKKKCHKLYFSFLFVFKLFFSIKSNGKPTIEALDGTELLPAYKKDALSDIDIAEIRKAYKCE